MEVLPICRMKVKIREKVVQLFNCHLMSNYVVIRNLRKKGKSLVYGFWPIWRRIDLLESKKIDIPHSEVSDHYPMVCDSSMRT